MNNRDIINTIGFMLMIFIIVIIYFFKYNSNMVDKSIENKIWYKYDYNTGYYEKIILKDKKIEYYRPSKLNDLNDFDICEKYTFDKKNYEFNLDCKKEIKINKIEPKKISLTIDNKEKKFFIEPEESLYNEFELYFNKSVIEYNKSKEQALDYIKINEQKLYEVLKNNEYSKIIIKGDKCTSIDCSLSYEIIEKWISKTENIYYYDTKDINDNVLKYFNKIDSELPIDINYYNDIYPKVIISNNNKIIDTYNIRCNGFDCSEYFENEF